MAGADEDPGIEPPVPLRGHGPRLVDDELGLEHRPVDRVPIDFGGHRSSGIMAIGYARLKRHLGIAAGNLGFHIRLPKSGAIPAFIAEQGIVGILGDKNLRFIAQELVKTTRENVTIDWTAKESVRAKLRVMVKRVLRKFGYPPDKQEAATNTVLQQAELLSDFWTKASAPSSRISCTAFSEYPWRSRAA